MYYNLVYKRRIFSYTKFSYRKIILEQVNMVEKREIKIEGDKID